MNAPRDDDEFARMMQDSGFGQTPQPPHWDPPTAPQAVRDPHPYGPPAAFPQAKPGLTKRGKVALSVGAAVLASGALIGYQSHTATVAENEARAKEMEIQAQLLRIQELKELNRANEVVRNSRTVEEKTRQVAVDSCVETNRKLIGQGMPAPTLGDIVADCQAQYTSPASGLDMQPASATQASAPASGGSVNNGLLLAGGALAVVLAVSARRGTRNNAA